MSQSNPGAFSEHLSRSSALYFAVTVFSTVGFGDITARTDAGRIVVTVMMLANLLIIGIGIRVLLSAVRLGHQRRLAAETDGTLPPDA
jgi:voltage-gated potassium channel Kch